MDSNNIVGREAIEGAEAAHEGNKKVADPPIAKAKKRWADQDEKEDEDLSWQEVALKASKGRGKGGNMKGETKIRQQQNKNKGDDTWGKSKFRFELLV